MKKSIALFVALFLIGTHIFVPYSAASTPIKVVKKTKKTIILSKNDVSSKQNKKQADISPNIPKAPANYMEAIKVAREKFLAAQRLARSRRSKTEERKAEENYTKDLEQAEKLFL
jgi:hypothetical protein